MSLTYHPLTSGASGDINTSFPTASISVAADRLALIWVSNSSSSSGQQADPDSITGAGRTWEKVAGIEFSAGYTRLSLWRSTGGAGSGALSIDWSTNRAGVCWSVFEVSGTLNLTNNGADTLGTPATNTNTNSTTLGVTLGAFADSNSGAVSGFGHENATDATVRTATADWTEVDDVGQAMSGFSESLETQFIASNDTTAGVTWSAADAATANGGIAVEVFGAAALSIDAQPTEQTAADGATATFTATVTGETSLQWERLAPGGGSWANVSGGSGATTESYTTGTLSRSNDAGALYRLNVDGGALYSEPALLRVTAVPASYSGVGLVVGSSASHVGAAAIGATDSTATNYPVTLNATCTTSATRAVSAQLARGATSSLTAAIARHVGAIRNATQALSADKNVLASLLRDATSTLTATAVAARVVLLALDSVSSLSATVSRTAQLVQSATTTATASIARSVSAIRDATAALSATAAAAVARTLDATTTATATATSQLTARRTFNAEQTLTAMIYNRAVTRLFTVTQTIVPTLGKFVAATRSATTTLTATVGRMSAQAVGATTTMSATVARQAARTVGATQAQTATVGRAMAITRTATQALSATALASRKFFVSLACSLSMTADLVLETIFGGHPFTPTRGARVHGAATTARVTSPTVAAGIPEAGAARVRGAASKARVR